MSNLGWYPPARPRPVADGIKARSTRGAIAQTWWSDRFLAVLEDMGMGSRLQRGRAYARKGQVMSLEVAAGSVTAAVQGTRPRPYRVRIGVTAFGKADWARIETGLAENAWYAAKLLAGEMPEDIETVFADAGLSLFPTSAAELSLDCSCPDFAVPCKHLAAVFYLLAESFDEDPFAILAWRGRIREDLLANLAAARSDRTTTDHEQHARPLADCLDTFFDRPERGAVAWPSTASPLLEQVPESPIIVRGRPLAELLRPAYRAFENPGIEHDKRGIPA